MRLLLFIATLFGIFATVFLFCAAAEADCRARIVPYQPQYVAPAVYATPVIQYQPQAYYTASYSGFTASSEAIFGKRLEDLNQKLDVFTQRLETIFQQGGNNRDMKQPQSHPGAVYLGSSCVKCHDSSVAKTKGGDLVMFDLGQLVADAKLQWTMQDAVKKGRMPKGGPKASDQQYDDLIEFFAEANSSKAAAQKQMPKEK